VSSKKLSEESSSRPGPYYGGRDMGTWATTALLADRRRKGGRESHKAQLAINDFVPLSSGIDADRKAILVNKSGHLRAALSRSQRSLIAPHPAAMPPIHADLPWTRLRPGNPRQPKGCFTPKPNSPLNGLKNNAPHRTHDALPTGITAIRAGNLHAIPRSD